MRKFEFKKAYEEIEIAGEVFKVSLKDDDRKEYSKQLIKFHQIVEEVKSIDEKDMPLEKAIELEEKVREISLETLDVLFGSGSGEKLYEAADQQVEELMPIVFSVAEIINERRQESLNKYTKPKKK